MHLLPQNFYNSVRCQSQSRTAFQVNIPQEGKCVFSIHQMDSRNFSRDPDSPPHSYSYFRILIARITQRVGRTRDIFTSSQFDNNGTSFGVFEYLPSYMYSNPLIFKRKLKMFKSEIEYNQRNCLLFSVKIALKINT